MASDAAASSADTPGARPSTLASARSASASAWRFATSASSSSRRISRRTARSGGASAPASAGTPPPSSGYSPLIHDMIRLRGRGLGVLARTMAAVSMAVRPGSDGSAFGSAVRAAPHEGHVSRSPVYVAEHQGQMEASASPDKVSSVMPCMLPRRMPPGIPHRSGWCVNPWRLAHSHSMVRRRSWRRCRTRPG